MHTIDVTFKKAEITRFDPRTGVAEVQFLINDGKDKQLVRHTKFDEIPQDWALGIVKEIRKKLQETHRSSDDDDVLGGFTTVRFKEEDALVERLIRFHAVMHDRIRGSTLSRMAYYDMERKMVGVKVMFDGTSDKHKTASVPSSGIRQPPRS